MEIGNEMMKHTHEVFSSSFWLGSTLLVDVVSVTLFHTYPINPAIAALGLVGAVPFSAGKNSPDFDQKIWPGPPKRGYPWNGHRGVTHRVWFALLVITPIFLIPSWVTWLITGWGTTWFMILNCSLPAGWWSHLMGDMIYGRILILGVPFGLGWTTNGIAEKGGRWLKDPAAKFFTATSLILMFLHCYMFVLFYV